jgi:transcriptional regulator with XRE-family HTH domain
MANTACIEAGLTARNVLEIQGGTAVLTGSQIRAARALLGWKITELAEKAGISYAAVQRAEAVNSVPNMQVRNLAAIKTAFEKAGIVFIDGDYAGRGGPGVRLKV